ncbi:MAG: ribosome silencing factor [Actinobacteria bacterium]|nr:ribosome silencing factor [Actinomycetota bacterium]
MPFLVQKNIQTKSDYLAVLAAQAAAEKLGFETIVIDVGEVIGITDFFVVTSCNNRRHMETIREEIEASLLEVEKIKPLRIEGKESDQWMLIDYGIFVVHIFDREWRSFYNLERLWLDQPTLNWEK